MLVQACDLSFEPDLRAARRVLSEWSPPDADQAATRDRMVQWIDDHPLDAHLRTCLAGHLTASALVVDFDRGCGLLTHHKKLGRWLQLGGHCDGDANLAHVALREAVEESGLAGLAIDPVPIDVDVHVIPARGDEPEHLHLDTRFLVVAPGRAEVVVSDESHALRWVAPAELEKMASDVSVTRLFGRVFGSRG